MLSTMLAFQIAYSLMVSFFVEASGSTAVFPFRVIVTTDVNGNLLDSSSEALTGYQFNVENDDEEIDYEAMFNAIKEELSNRISNLDLTYTDMELSWDSDGYFISIEGGDDLSVAIQAMQNSSVYQIYLKFNPKDGSVAECIPFKDHEARHLYAAMSGYDAIIGNPADSIVDPGVKARIFLHDCESGYYNFISGVSNDLNCDSDFTMRTISSIEEYDSERTSSVDFAFSVAVSVSSSFWGIDASASASYARATNSDERAAEKVFEEYNGEIILAEATCITESVSIADAVRPIYTQNFINHLIIMDEASASDDTTLKRNVVKNFINEFGTHFMKTTKLGAQLTFERRFESKSNTVDEELERSKCVHQEASASISASGWGTSVDVEGSLDSEVCGELYEFSKFGLNQGIEGTKTLSRGSRPKELEAWIDEEFIPVPVKRYLEQITVLFKDEWLTQSSFYGFERDLAGSNITLMFEQIIPDYCSLMLEGILYEDCSVIGCDTFQCLNEGTCVYGDSHGARCECPDDVYGDNCEIVEDSIVTNVVYQEGTSVGTSTYSKTVQVYPDQEYSIDVEVLRGGLADDNSKISDIRVDGISIGQCNPIGSDYACDFYECGEIPGTKIFSSSTGSFVLEVDYVGQSYKCDCDLSSWTCASNIGSVFQVDNPTQVVAAARINFKPWAKEYEAVENTVCEFPLGKNIDESEILTHAEAETYCNSNATCKMFFAPNRNIEEYYLCPYGSVTKTLSGSDVYMKPLQFTLGNVGVHECPDGYEPISFPNTCELASAALGIVYDKDANVIDERSVCNQCGACNGLQSFLTNDYGNNARWICQIEGFATEHNQFHFHDMRNCAPYYHVIEDANYAAAIEFCSEDNTCAMFYQKKSSATDQGDEFYFCSADAEIKSDNTHDHLHVKLPGFEKVIGLSQEVCDNGQLLSVLYNTEDIRECRESCETNPNCVFFSFFDEITNYENVCALFRSCMERDTATHSGTTYQVAKGYVKYQKMGTNIPCPIGMEIDNSEECEDARLWAYDLGISLYSSRSSSVYVGSWDHVPSQCSYQSGGDLTFHFNTRDIDDVASFESGVYKMICRKGKNELLVDSATTCSTDANEITSVTDTDEPSCISRCDLTPECGYSFYGEDNSCSLYHTCDEREEITTMGTTYQKLGNVWQCNWHCYLNRYLGLQEVFGFDNVNAAFRHWFNFGQFEGRDCTCDQLDIPICDGCGSREQECWQTCQDENGEGNERGFCEKCNSYIGTKGACCMLNNPGDPEECQAVPESSFLYTTYHMCVLVPDDY